MHAAERYLELCFFFFNERCGYFFFLSVQGHLPHPNLRNEGKQLRALTYLHQTGWLVLAEVHWYRNTADFTKYLTSKYSKNKHLPKTKYFALSVLL